MRRLALLLGLIGLSVSASVFAAVGPSSPQTTANLTSIEQLGARDPRARDLARRRLLAEAPAALPLLRQALRHRNPAVRRQALRLLPALEDASLFAPKRITLRIRDQTLNQVLEQLGKVSGYPIRTQGFFVQRGPGAPKMREKTYSYEFVNEPFWDVIDRLCRDAELTVQQQSWGNEAILLYPATGRAPHVGRSGPFRYVASNIELRRTVGVDATAGRTESLTFNFQVFAEPRLSFARASAARVQAAYDDLGNSLLIRTASFVASGGSTPNLSGMVRSVGMSVSLQLQRPAEKATTMTLLRGVIPVSVQTREKRILLAEKILEAKGKTIVVDGADFRITEVWRANDQFRVSVEVVSKTRDISDLRYLYYRMELFDDKGKKLSWNSASSHFGSTSAGASMSYRLPGGPKVCTPAKLEFLHWETKEHLIPFEFRNVPLP